MTETARCAECARLLVAAEDALEDIRGTVCDACFVLGPYLRLSYWKVLAWMLVVCAIVLAAAALGS